MVFSLGPYYIWGLGCDVIDARKVHASDRTFSLVPFQLSWLVFALKRIFDVVHQNLWMTLFGHFMPFYVMHQTFVD